MIFKNDFLRCIFMPFSVIQELDTLRVDVVTLFLLAKKRTPDIELRSWIEAEELYATEEQLDEFLDTIEALCGDELDK